MTKYSILVLPSAQKVLEKLPQKVQGKVFKALVSLGRKPRPIGCKKLVRTDSWRFRIAEYRVQFGTVSLTFSLDLDQSFKFRDMDAKRRRLKQRR